MRRDGIPPSGPNVFQPGPTDHRTVYLIPVGGVVLTARFPLATSGDPRPIRVSTHYLKDLPVVTLDASWVDPYHLSETFPNYVSPEVVAEPAEQGAA